MGATVEFNLTMRGLASRIVRSREMHERLKDLTEVFEQGDEVFRAELDQQFRTEGAHFLRKKWAPLSPAYAARKPQPPQPFGILYLTGDLYRSLTKEGGEHIKIVTPGQAMYGSMVPYGKYHQTGTPKMPQRKIILLTNRMRRWFVRAVINWVVTGNRPGNNASITPSTPDFPDAPTWEGRD